MARPLRSASYLAFIRSLPCMVCLHGRFRTEAAHTNVYRDKGMGQKGTDYGAVPLCDWHHRHNSDALDVAGMRRFQRIHKIDLAKMVHLIQAIYVGQTGKPIPEQYRDQPRSV